MIDKLTITTTVSHKDGRYIIRSQFGEFIFMMNYIGEPIGEIWSVNNIISDHFKEFSEKIKEHHKLEFNK